tara:strand:- start:2745 stop:3221 length:477 start_codon:yes stop_codon:yes gene_type:complete
MNIKDIQQLIKFVAKSGVSEVKIESEELKIAIKTSPNNKQVVYSNVPPLTQAPQTVEQPESSVIEPLETQEIKSELDNNFITIKSPIIGTFYRKPAPEKPNFIETGDTINEGDVLCVIEAMKLFNEIESEQSGKIIKILVENASPVEFDQPLFVLDPS